MTAEEFIEMVRADAAAFAPADAARFARAATEELVDFRTPTPERIERTERTEWTERRTTARRPRPPVRYADQAELWIVFSLFVTHFVHPVGAALEVAEFVSEQEEPEVRRFVVAAEGDAEAQGEVRAENLDELTRDYVTLVELAQELGSEVFDGDFDIQDFLEPEVTFPDPEEEDGDRGFRPEGER